MKKVLFILFAYMLLPVAQAQISSGGEPLFLLPAEGAGLRQAASDESLFIEMPSFNVDSVLAEDMDETKTRGAFIFAHKFYHKIERGTDGHSFAMADGTKVWQVGIRSAGAYSINLFFSKYKLPKGGKLFIYNTDRTHIIGAFTHQNNTDDDMLAIAPVAGDEIIIEYSEPANVEFPGELTITEINHDYRGIMETLATTGHDCMPDAMDAIPDSAVVNSTVYLIMNGRALCSGSLINNAGDSIQPYLLTAMHCFNNPPSSRSLAHYRDRARDLVVAFNYQRPQYNDVVNSPLVTNISQTISGAELLCVVDRNDAMLLKLKETPPESYNPFYAGWNIHPEPKGPFFNLHHPNGNLKKYGFYNNESIPLTSFGGSFFNYVIHWRVLSWTIGSTDSGSSGSPLFDKNGLIIGALTGGSSECVNSNPSNRTADYFYALHKSWEYDISNDTLHLKRWLDPLDTGITSLKGRYPWDVPQDSTPEVKPPTSLILYSRQTGEVTILHDLSEVGVIKIYTIDGVLIDTYSTTKTPFPTIDPKFRNQIGTITLTSERKTETIKVIF